MRCRFSLARSTVRRASSHRNREPMWRPSRNFGCSWCRGAVLTCPVFQGSHRRQPAEGTALDEANGGLDAGYRNRSDIEQDE